MTAPTLALGVSAPGASEIEKLAGYVKSLTDDLEKLKAVAAGGGMGGLDKLTAEVASMRKELGVAVQGIRTDLAALTNALKDGYGKAQREAADGGTRVADEIKKQAVKVRVAGSVDLGGGLKASMSGSFADRQAVRAVMTDIEQNGDALAAATAKRLAKMEELKAKSALALRGEDNVRLLLGLPTASQMQSETALIKAQMEATQREIDAVSQHRLKSASPLRTEDDTRRLLGLPTTAEMQTATALLKTQMEEAQTEIELLAQHRLKSASPLRTEDDTRRLLGLPTRSEMMQSTAALKAQIEEMEALATQRVHSAPRLVTEDDTRRLLGLPTRAQMERETSLIKAQMERDAEIIRQVAAANKAAFAGRSGPFSVLGTREELNQVKVQTDNAALALERFATSSANAGKSAHSSHGQIIELAGGLRITGGAAREAGVLLEEGLGGNFGRMRQTMFSFLNQMGVMKSLILGLLSPVGLLASALAVVGYAMAKGQQEVTEFKNAMTLTGGYIGKTRGELEELAHTLTEQTSTSIGTAKSVLMDLAKTGRVTGDEMGVLGQAIVYHSKLSGESLEALVKDYAKMPDGVHKWAEEHNKSMHFMNQAELEHIRTLELEGKTQEAVIEVGKKLIDHMKSQTENLGYLEKGWRGIKNMASAAWDAMLGLGREDTIEQQMEKIRGRIAALQKASTDAGAMGKYQNGQGLDSGPAVESLREQLKFLEKLKTSQEDLAHAKAETARIEEEGNKAGDYLRGLDLKVNKTFKEAEAMRQLTVEVEKNNAAWLKAGNPASKVWDGNSGFITPAIQAQMRSLLNQKIQGSIAGNNSEINSVKQEYKSLEALMKSEYSNEQKLLDEQYRDRIVNQGEYQAESIKLSKSYEDELFDAFNEADDKYKTDLQKRIDKINASNQGANTKKAEIKALQDAYDTWYYTQWDKIDELTAKAAAHNAGEADKAVGDMNKLTEANKQYWAQAEQGVQRESDLAKARAMLANATDEERARAEAMIKVEDARGAQLYKLQKQYDDAQKSVTDYVAIMGDPSTYDDPQVQAAYDSLTKAAKGYGDALAYARREMDKLKGIASDAAATDLQNKRDQEMRDDAKKMGKVVTEKLADAILSGGKTGFKGLIDWAKEYLLRNPLKVILQGILQPIGTAVTNAVLGFQGLGSIGGAASSASSLLNAGGIAGSLGSFGTAAGYGAQALFAGNGLTALSGGANMVMAGNLAQGFGMIAGVLGPIAIGVGLIASLIKKGGGPKTDSYYNYAGHADNNIDQGAKSLYDTIQSGFSTVAQQLNLTQTQLQGLGVVVSADPKGTAQTQLDVSLPGQFSRGTLYGTTENVGRSEDELKAAMAQAAEQAIIVGLLNAPDLDQKLKDYLAKVDLKGTTEELAAKVTDVINAQALYKSFKDLGSAFGYVQNMSVETVKALADAGGGFEALTANLQTYYKEFYTADEQRNASAQAIADKINSNSGGLIGTLDTQQILDMSRTQFRQLVESIDVSTEAGQKLFGTLMQVAGAFASIHQDAAAATGDAEKLWEALRGMPMGRIASLSAEATNELIKFAGGIDTLAGNIQNYYKNFYTPGEQRTAATQDISRTLSAAGLPITADQVGQMTRDQFRQLVDSVDLTTTSGRVLYAALMSVAGEFSDITPAADSAASSLQTTVSSLQETIDKFKDFGKQLREFRDSLLLGDLSPLTPAEKYAEAAAQFNSTYNAAMGGDADAMARLQQVSQDFLQASRDYNASNDQYTHDFSQVQAALTLAAAKSDSIVSTAQQQLTVAQSQLDQLTNLNTNVSGLSQSILDALKLQASNPTTTIPGTSTSGGGSNFLSQVYSMYYTRGNYTPDAQGLAYWTGLLQSGMSYDQVLALFNQSFDYVTAHNAATPHALGNVANGLSLVGEHGPELIDFKTPSRVYSAAQTSGMFAAAGITQEMRELIAEVKALRAQHGQGVRAQIGATYDAHDKSAEKIVNGTNEKNDRAGWSDRQKVTLE